MGLFSSKGARSALGAFRDIRAGRKTKMRDWLTGRRLAAKASKKVKPEVKKTQVKPEVKKTQVKPKIKSPQRGGSTVGKDFIKRRKLNLKLRSPRASAKDFIRKRGEYLVAREKPGSSSKSRTLSGKNFIRRRAMYLASKKAGSSSKSRTPSAKDFIRKRGEKMRREGSSRRTVRR
jgi:hypothetical protein